MIVDIVEIIICAVIAAILMYAVHRQGWKDGFQSAMSLLSSDELNEAYERMKKMRSIRHENERMD